MWPTKSKKCSVMDMKVNFMAGYPAFFITVRRYINGYS